MRPLAITILSLLFFAAPLHAAEIEFRASETGAINRALDAKLGDVINALDYATVDDAIDDTAALQSAIDAVPSKGTLYFGCGAYIVSGSGAEVFFRDKPINLVAEGNCAQIDVTNVAPTTDLFRFVPSTDFARGWSVIGLEIVHSAVAPVRHFLHFDSTTNDTTYFTAVNIENNRVQSVGGNAVYANNSLTNVGGGFHTSQIVGNSFNNPIWFSNAGDAILVSDNVLSGQLGVPNPCIYYNLIAGGGNLRIIGNVMSCIAGMIIGDAGAAAVIVGNILEQRATNTESNNALIDFRGNARPIDGATVIGNQITVPPMGATGDPIPVYVGNAERVVVSNNQFRTASAYPNIVVSASAVDTLVSFNQYANGGASPVSDAGTGTNWLTASKVALADKANVFTETQTSSKAVQFYQPSLFEQSWDDATIGPLVPVRRKSASPAANDLGGAFQFQFQNSLGAIFDGGFLSSVMLDATAGSEDAAIAFQTKVGGTAIAERMRIHQGVTIGGPPGGDKGPGTLNATEIYSNNVALGAAVADLISRVDALEGQ